MKRSGLWAAAVVVVVLCASCGTTVQLGKAGSNPPTDGLSSTVSTSGSSASSASTATGSTGPPGSVSLGPQNAQAGEASASSSGATEQTGGSGTSPPAGVSSGTAAKAPIEVGIVLTSTSSFGSFGYSLGNSYSEEDFDQALVAGLNSTGGLAGRKIEAVYASTNPSDADWQVDFQAACATFTQDNHVAAVLGYEFDYFNSFETCLAQKGIPHLTTQYNVPDALTLQQFPLFKALDIPTMEQRTMEIIDGARSTGALTTSSKLGILTDNCTGSQASLNDVVLPALAADHVDVVKQFTAACTTGEGGTAQGAEEVDNAVLQFSTAGVNRIILHGVVAGVALAQFAIEAQTQGYTPVYLLDSLAGVTEFDGLVPATQMQNMAVFGWAPMADVPISSFGPMNGNQKRCLALLKAHGVTPASSSDYVYAWQICEPLFVYQDALERDDGTTNGPAVINAVNSLGTDYQSVINLGGASDFSASRASAPVEAQPLAYRSGCECFAYVDEPYLIPDVSD